MSDTLLQCSLGEAAALLAQKQVSSTELTQLCLKQIDKQKHLGAFLHVASEGALMAAQAADERRQQGRSWGPLDGIPLALKDNLTTLDMPTTCGSKMLAGFCAHYDATAVQKLRAAGAVILGKLNMDEFAMGSSNEHSAFFPCRNPWDPQRIPGGSSGGAAVAVASHCAYATLGSDTGGSIRQPAALTGVVGLKPSYGRVSRYGLVAYASSLDQIGPMARSVLDCAHVLRCLSGADGRDATCAAEPVEDFAAETQKPLGDLRLGVVQEFWQHPSLHPEIKASCEKALEVYRSMGAQVVEVSLPHSRYAIAAYYVLASAEASSNLSRFDGVRYGKRAEAADLQGMYRQTRSLGFGQEVLRRIVLGTAVLSSAAYEAEYGRALKARRLIAREYLNSFTKCDVLVSPTTPQPAFLLGEKVRDPMQMYLSDILTVSLNLSRGCGISIPCGLTQQGLPIGLQLMGKPMDESRLLRTAYAYEQNQPFTYKANG